MPHSILITALFVVVVVEAFFLGDKAVNEVRSFQVHHLMLANVVRNPLIFVD